MKTSLLAQQLELTDEDIREMEIDLRELKGDRSGSDYMVCSFYFYIPKKTPKNILDKKGWSVGDRIEVNLNLFDR